jgi:hypothetical protein
MPGSMPDGWTRPSARDNADFMHHSHAADADCYGYLARRLESHGLVDLAEQAARWSREHAQVARDLRRRSR